MKTRDYWQKRFEQLESAQLDKGTAFYHELERQYSLAARAVEKEIAGWYSRFATENEISLSEAKKLLSGRDLQAFRMDVKEYIKKGRSLDPQWIKQLEQASVRVHVSRLEALKVQMQQQVEALHGYEADGLDRLARDIYTDGYYRTAFEIAKGSGVGASLAALDTNKINKVISKPWAPDGKNFSGRIWTNRSKLVDELHTVLTQNIIRGQAPDNAIKTISKRFDVSKHQAGRLIMTESAYFSSVAQKDSFNAVGVERFEVVATLDEKTSDTCQSLDGQVFKMSDFEVGVTAPPFHQWCRTTTVPYFEDLGGERASRDDEGNYKTVPENMTYKEWAGKNIDVSGVENPVVPKGVKVEPKTKPDVDETKSINQIKDFDELKTYMKNKHNVSISNSVKNLDFESVRESMEGIEKVLDEFPQARSSFKSVDVRKDGIMSAGYEGDINFNPFYYGTRERAIEASISKTHFHPTGNNVMSTGSHEMGHILEKALIDKMANNETMGKLLWMDKSISKSIVSDAVSNAKKLPAGKGKLKSKLIGEISEYARSDNSECLAEAVADYVLNGDNAAVLSKEIWKLLKKELG